MAVVRDALQSIKALSGAIQLTRHGNGRSKAFGAEFEVTCCRCILPLAYKAFWVFSACKIF
ncbi:hypothetical protein [Nostoc sp. ChiSLP03a]|uniref:hypothetical protein n=1 Tax=Nostoc sp. ChiSLP03a TaxID=3075380 RepID=UPI002AD4CDBB|nr:hypothetical protein [Nostoc sp. ChiSLP03a]MDZ8214457.1 hypothetical protein [Nostoc sp. ChiSLP03a]